MGKKVYAIKEGYDFINNKKVQNVIVDTWAECLKCVKGVKGAKYKSFMTKEEALEFLNEETKMLKKGVDSYPEDIMHIYVDGSYNIQTEKYGYAFVAVKNNIILHIENGGAKDIKKKDIRQIAGELEGTIKGVEYALDNGIKEVVIFHDYEGIAHHATGFWNRRDESSKEYYEKINYLMNKGIKIIFVKVDSHTGDLFNEVVDEKAKEAIDVKSNNVVLKWLQSNKIKVSNIKLKNQILSIAPSREENIEVIKN